ncbi:GumC family protein [candidate division KSB1 bacterium]|nr:GumC family protein [candidate division KSB1 bacterium]
MDQKSINSSALVVRDTKNRPDTLRNILIVLFKRKWIIISVFMLIMCVVILVTWTQKRIYLAESKIMIQKEMESEKSLLFRMNLDLSLEQHDLIKSEIEIITSSPVALQIIHDMQLHRTEFFGTDSSAVNLLLAMFQSQLSVEKTEDTNVLDISFRAKDPCIAAAVVNNIVKAYIDFRAQLYNESEEYHFFDEQIRIADEKLRELEERQTQFKQSSEMLSPVVQIDILLEKIADYEKALTNARTDRIGREAMLRVIKREIASGEMVNVPVTESSNASSREKYIAKLRGDMLDLQLKRDLLLQKFKPEYEEVVNLEQAIASTKTRIVKEIEEIVSLETIAIKALKAEEQALQTTIDNLKQQTNSFAQKEYEFSQLSRGIEDNREIYSMLLKQREEARISQAKLVSGVKIRVISPALVPSYPVSPNRRQNVLMGIILGTFSALGLALLIEYFDQSFNSPEQIGERLNLPVWGSISTIDDKFLFDNSIRNTNRLQL